MLNYESDSSMTPITPLRMREAAPEISLKEVVNLIEKQSEPGVLNYSEVINYYEMLKNPALKDQMDDNKQKSLTRKCWKTMKRLMNALLLIDEYNILFESYNKKEKENKNSLTDTLIKLLLRCQKLYDSQQECVRILVKIKN